MLSLNMAAVWGEDTIIKKLTFIHSRRSKQIKHNDQNRVNFPTVSNDKWDVEVESYLYIEFERFSLCFNKHLSISAEIIKCYRVNQ